MSYFHLSRTYLEITVRQNLWPCRFFECWWFLVNFEKPKKLKCPLRAQFFFLVKNVLGLENWPLVLHNPGVWTKSEMEWSWPGLPCHGMGSHKGSQIPTLLFLFFSYFVYYFFFSLVRFPMGKYHHHCSTRELAFASATPYLYIEMLTGLPNHRIIDCNHKLLL